MLLEQTLLVLWYAYLEDLSPSLNLWGVTGKTTKVIDKTEVETLVVSLLAAPLLLYESKQAGRFELKENPNW